MELRPDLPRWLRVADADRGEPDDPWMEGRLLGLVPLFRFDGPEMTLSETVTLLNDLFFLMPGALVRAGIEWEAVDARTVRAAWTHAGHTVLGLACFDEAGDLVDFASRDRYQMDRDPPVRSRWTTPLRDHATFDGVRLAGAGEGRWGAEGEAWPYVEIGIEALRYDPGGGMRSRERDREPGRPG